jgi:DMSO/TMAO reductase YedYZ molybdopterin-dependent catalytic subunit
MSYPIYILDLGEGEPTIVFPKDKEDLDHSDFWEREVAGIVARHFRLNIEDLKNLPYSQRRARIAGNNVLYGERTSKKLLKLIEKAVGETGLQFVYDEHESRLSYDVEEFNALLSQE